MWKTLEKQTEIEYESRGISFKDINKSCLRKSQKRNILFMKQDWQHIKYKNMKFQKQKCYSGFLSHLNSLLKTAKIVYWKQCCSHRKKVKKLACYKSMLTFQLNGSFWNYVKCNQVFSCLLSFSKPSIGPEFLILI